MADAAEFYGQLSDEETVEITDDEPSSKISVLNQRVNNLERQNSITSGENQWYKQQIEVLKASIKDLTVENVELKNRVDKAESENRVLGSVAARAAELEGEVSRLQHDLASALSDLNEATVELSDLKRVLKGVEDSDLKLDAIGKERDLLAVEKSKSLEKLKDDLEKTIEKMKEEISGLETNLEEKEKVISGFSFKERGVANDVNCDSLIKGENKGLIGGLKQKDWVVVGGSTAAAVVVMGAAWYIRTSKKL